MISGLKENFAWIPPLNKGIISQNLGKTQQALKKLDNITGYTTEPQALHLKPEKKKMLK